MRYGARHAARWGNTPQAEGGPTWRERGPVLAELLDRDYDAVLDHGFGVPAVRLR